MVIGRILELIETVFKFTLTIICSMSPLHNFFPLLLPLSFQTFEFPSHGHCEASCAMHKTAPLSDTGAASVSFLF